MANWSLVAARKDLGLTQSQLGQRVGLTKPEIIKIERHGWIPAKPIRDRIARVLRSTDAALFGDVIAQAQT